MSRVILYMAMSLDGFITGPHDDADHPAGINGMRLMDWLGGDETIDGPRGFRPTDPTSRIVFDECLRTGAVITGRRTGEFAGYWGGDHHDGVPIFVPTRQAPAATSSQTTSSGATSSQTASSGATSSGATYENVHFVTDGIESCVAQAKAAAGDRDVMLHGAYTAQECLKAGVLDVIEIQLRPILLGQGRLLFDGLSPDHIELDLVRIMEAPTTLHLRYEVRR